MRKSSSLLQFFALALLFLLAECAPAHADFFRPPRPTLECEDAAPDSQKHRLALLIGNELYPSVPNAQLLNPVSDVDLVGKSLERLGFTVAYAKNAGAKVMREAVNDLARKLKAAPACSVGLVYYAGLGGVEKGTGIEYLAPTDIAFEVPLSASALSVDSMVEMLSNSAPHALRVIVLDSGQQPIDLGERAKGSAAEVKPDPDKQPALDPLEASQAGLLVVHSSGRGAVAVDTGDRGSPFARVFAEEIGKPGVEIVSALRSTQAQTVKKVRAMFPDFTQYPDVYITPFPATYLAGKEPPAVIPPGRRLGLLIGNQKYAHAVGPLDNPSQDIRLVGDALKSIGFELQPIVEDGTRDQIMLAIVEFAEKLKEAGPDAIGFVYYSGHGAAIGGQNYIIPVDVEEPSSRLLQVKGVSSADILSKLQEAAPEAAQYIVLDACRNNLGGSRGGKGFVPVDNRPGMLIAFATEPGRTASDIGANGGPYARALANHLRLRGQSDLIMFHNVRIQVMTETKDEQVPWVQDGIRTRTRIYFAGP